ncbi:ricin-type beta-trefoil lectin domain protein [Collimonas sp. NPDC087041]|uniref:RICIN domain-containing protein n=1 Tax=Collimonas sp. NPDC087041 TaxID=3363960 RepID=UPI00382146BE
MLSTDVTRYFFSLSFGLTMLRRFENIILLCCLSTLIMLIGCTAAMGMSPPPAPIAKGKYSVVISFADAIITAPTTIKATLVLTNSDSTTSANVQFGVALPLGFTATDLVQGCGGLLSSKGNLITMTAATVQVGESCIASFSLVVPSLALATDFAPHFSIIPASGSNHAVLADQSIPSLYVSRNTPTKTPAKLGTTPALFSWSNIPAPTKAMSELDFTITPMNDPGPNSDVFWSNQIQSIGGYTGLQSTVSKGQHGGRLFLFSLWGAVAAVAGSYGSSCSVNATATDGNQGAQCRIYYDWKVGHTYKFQVTPTNAIGVTGDGWFTSSVSDITTGVANPDSFVIGSIKINLATKPAAASSFPKQSGDVVQWVEYFDWNSHRTTCLSVPYSEAIMTMSAVDAVSGKTVIFTTDSVSTGKEPCVAAINTRAGNSSKFVAGIGQSAQGLIKSGDSGSCLSSVLGAADGTLQASNFAILSTCPTAAKVGEDGGSSAANSLWVIAVDHSIQLHNNYCLTASDALGATGAVVVVASCIPGAINQQWNITIDPKTKYQSISSALSGLCLSNFDTDLTPQHNARINLAPCRTAVSIWSVPGKNFSY